VYTIGMGDDVLDLRHLYQPRTESFDKRA